MATTTLRLNEAEYLGGGSFGTVFGGTMADNPVAVKLVGWKHRSIFEREHAALQKVTMHPNICRIFGTETVGDRFALIMQRLTKDNLFEYMMSQGPFVESTVCSIMHPIIAAVAHCHRNMVTHCDIKLENVGFDMLRQPVLIDFGAANTGRSGSIAYAAPETFSKTDALDVSHYVRFSKRDVWSLAVCIFALTQGVFPFQVANPVDWRFKRVFPKGDESRQKLNVSVASQVCCLYSRASKLSLELDALLDTMFVIDPDDRLPAQDVLTHGWFKAGNA